MAILTSSVEVDCFARSKALDTGAYLRHQVKSALPVSNPHVRMDARLRFPELS